MYTSLHFKSDCRAVFSSHQGKRVLSYLMKQGCVTTPVAVAGDKDQSLRNEGMQHLTLSILKAVYRNPTELEEHIEDELTQ